MFTMLKVVTNSYPKFFFMAKLGKFGAISVMIAVSDMQNIIYINIKLNLLHFWPTAYDVKMGL